MKFLIYFIFWLVSYGVYAQSFFSNRYNDRYFTVSFGTGMASYFGELNYSNSLNDNISVISLGSEVRLFSRLGCKIELDYFTLEGTDVRAPDISLEKQRNLSFHSKNIQAYGNFVFYFKHYNEIYYRRWLFDPYLTGGVGFINFKPTTNFQGVTYNLREHRTESIDYNVLSWTIPVGLGAKFKINSFLNFNVEVLYFFPLTDYLDDVSSTYPLAVDNDISSLLSNRKDEILIVNQKYYDRLRPGELRGNPNNNDSYLLIKIKAEFFLSPNLFSKSQEKFKN